MSIQEICEKYVDTNKDSLYEDLDGKELQGAFNGVLSLSGSEISDLVEYLAKHAPSDPKATLPVTPELLKKLLEYKNLEEIVDTRRDDKTVFDIKSGCCSYLCSQRFLKDPSLFADLCIVALMEAHDTNKPVSEYKALLLSELAKRANHMSDGDKEEFSSLTREQKELGLTEKSLEAALQGTEYRQDYPMSTVMDELDRLLKNTDAVLLSDLKQMPNSSHMRYDFMLNKLLASKAFCETFGCSKDNLDVTITRDAFKAFEADAFEPFQLKEARSLIAQARKLLSLDLMPNPVCTSINCEVFAGFLAYSKLLFTKLGV